MNPLSRVHPYDRWKYKCAAWCALLAYPALWLGMRAGQLYDDKYLPLQLAATPPTVITKLVPVPAPSPITRMTTTPDAGERPVLVSPVGRSPKVTHASVPRTTPPAVPVAPPVVKAASEAPSTTSNPGPTVSGTSAPTRSAGPTTATGDVPTSGNAPLGLGRLRRATGL